MKRADVVRIAAERRARVLAMRATGATWEAIAAELHVSWQRARALARPRGGLRGNPTRADRVMFAGTISEYLERQRLERAEFARAHGFEVSP